MKPLLLSVTAAALLGGTLSLQAAQVDARTVIEVERGPHHRALARLDANGSASPHHAVELASGMHFWDGAAWSRSEAMFQETDQGFVASRVQAKVRLLPDLNTRGSVTLQTAEGTNIFSTPLAIALYDAAGGTFQVIGTLTNSTGILLGNNQVWYPNAFAGVCADVLFTITQGTALEQDIILTSKLDPNDFGFPRASTRIQILTEVYDTEIPDITRLPFYVEQSGARAQMVSPDVMDDTLSWGAGLLIGMGSAYASPSVDETNGVSAFVAKEYKTVNQRTFLIETVAFSSLARGLLSLPDCQPPGGGEGALPKTKGMKNYAALPPAPGQAKAQASAKTGKRLAQALPRRPTVTVDYRATLSAGATTLQCDTTYLISSGFSASSLTIEGGTVCKFKTNTSITVTGTLTCKTSAYRMGIFSCVDDDTCGESMNGYTNSGYTGSISAAGYANPALAVSSGQSISNCRFCFAQAAIGNSTYPATYSVTAAHSQFVSCIKGISIGSSTSSSGSGSGSGSAVPSNVSGTLNNVLMCSVKTPFTYPSPLASATCSVSDSTVDMSDKLYSGPALTFTAYNSIFANITNSSVVTNTYVFNGGNNGFYTSVQSFGTSILSLTNWPFQSAGAGNYYLTDASSCRNYGTTTGPPAAILTDLKSRTTYPPVVVAGTTWTTDQNLTAQAQWDTDPPDIGWHYAPLDYELGWIYTTNCTVTLSNGVAIGTFGTNAAGGGTYGLAIGPGARLTSVGLPNRPNWFAAYNAVQEQPITFWFQPTNGSVISEFQNLSASAGIYCRFTQWSVLSQAATHFYGPTNSGPFLFQDCEFHGGSLTTLRPTVSFTNCLMERTYTDLEPKDGLTTYIRNCLVFGANFTFAPSNSLVQDNLFDKPTITNWNGYEGTNAYITNSSRLSPNRGNDIQLTSSPSYQAGPLGNYYLLSSSQIINAGFGGTTADQVGLYHYTVTTNISGGYQIKETNSVVDIMYHYVATDTNGLPIDTDGDGISDYLEDANGNGLVDGAENSWTNYNSPNGLSLGSGLQVFTPLK